MKSNSNGSGRGSGRGWFEEFNKGPVVPILKDEVYAQVVEMARRKSVARGDEDEVELGPVTPPCVQGAVERVEFNTNHNNKSGGGNNNNNNNNNNNDAELLMQQTPFTSLLMLPSDGDLRRNNYGSEEGDLLWTCNPAYQPPQVCICHHINLE